MLRRILLGMVLAGVLATGAWAQEEPLCWVDFDLSADALEAAMNVDIATWEQEQHLCWVDILAFAKVHSGGQVTPLGVQNAVRQLQGDAEPEELLGENAKYYHYYQQAYGAVLGGLLGSYAIQKADGSWQPEYGLKAFCPVAGGWSFSHCQDFGAARSFGFRRKHLGNDLMGTLGAPIAAVEGGTVEALGWNRYGGWRVGVRSFDGRRYYYYAHLRKDTPFAPGLKVGDTVAAGDILGYMGRTGYSDTENVNNIQVVHLHFGMELIFDEGRRAEGKEIWIDVYPIVELLRRHPVTVVRGQENGCYRRAYPYVDLDREPLPE